MIKEFNNLEEIQQYYDKETNTYIFREDGKPIDLVVFNFDLSIEANIYAQDINAKDINAKNINAWNIIAYDIKADDIYACDINARDINVRDIDAGSINANNIKAKCITYYAVCFAYKNIKCKSIEGLKEHAKHFVLDGTLEVLENEN